MKNLVDIVVVTGGNISKNPRAFKDAQTFAKAGWKVKLVYLCNYEPAIKYDQALLATALFDAYPLDFVSRTGMRRLISFFSRVRIKIGTQINKHGGNCSWALGPTWELLSAVRRHKARLYVMHNETAMWVGSKLMKEGETVAMDIEDWYSEDLPLNERKYRPCKLLVELEAEMIEHAAYVVTTAKAMASALQARYGGRLPNVVTNSFALQANPNAGELNHPPVLFWFSQRLGRGRGLEAFLAVFSRIKTPCRVVLLGEPSLGYREFLLTQVPLEKRSSVSFLDLVSSEELPSVIARYDIGLALEERVLPNKEYTISNKILQYLNAGLSIIASPTQGHREVLSRDPLAGKIVDFNNLVEATSILDQVLADHDRLIESKRASRALAESAYCWEREGPKLVEIAHSAMNTKPTAE